MSNMSEVDADYLFESKYLGCPLVKSGCQLRSTRTVIEII